MAAFATMLNCELNPGTPQILERLKPHHEISGVIGISGELSGTVILSTDRGVAEKATQVMFDTTGDVSDDEAHCRMSCCRIPERRFTTPGDGHGGTCLGQRHGDGQPNACSAAGHQRMLSVEVRLHDHTFIVSCSDRSASR